jgi:hypothetical protein
LFVFASKDRKILQLGGIDLFWNDMRIGDDIMPIGDDKTGANNSIRWTSGFLYGTYANNTRLDAVYCRRQIGKT